MDLTTAADALGSLDEEHRNEAAALRSNLEAQYEVEANLRGELAHAQDALQAERAAWAEVEAEVENERAQRTRAEDELREELQSKAEALAAEQAARNRTEAALAEAVRPRAGEVERLETHLVDLAAAATDEVVRVSRRYHHLCAPSFVGSPLMQPLAAHFLASPSLRLMRINAMS